MFAFKTHDFKIRRSLINKSNRNGKKVIYCISFWGTSLNNAELSEGPNEITIAKIIHKIHATLVRRLSNALEFAKNLKRR